MIKVIMLLVSTIVFGSAVFANEKECINGFCVGDKVITDGSDWGSVPVLAIDKKTNICVYNSARFGTDAYKTDCNRLAATKGCLDDICVGDMVLPDDFYGGDDAPVKGINFAKQRYVINTKYIITQWARYKAGQLTVIKKNKKARKLLAQ